MRESGKGAVSMEETWVGRVMFPEGRLKGIDAQRIEAPSALAQSLDTTLVYMLSLEGYSIYWCQELMSVVLRVRDHARTEGFDLALGEAVQQCFDTTARALILDFRDAPDFFYPITTEELGIEDFGRQIIVVHPDFEGELYHDGGRLYGFRSFALATAWARASFQLPPPRARDSAAALATNKEAKLVAANYMAAVYWIGKSGTLAVIYSGQELEDQAAAALLLAVSSYLKHLRALSVIVDLRHRINIEKSWLEELSTAIGYLQSRGAQHFIVVGGRRAQESPDDPVQVYLELLSHAHVRASLVQSFDQALAACVPRTPRKLAS